MPEKLKREQKIPGEFLTKKKSNMHQSPQLPLLTANPPLPLEIP